ncbi:hypothetical protein PtrM4_129490 [Pyrenophora tritici-repentis]|uniref:Reverse transcriptase/retrotransposon-derived protein RNase H-like domain-containing protein n=1 Tax=Pyrenophora tritici-repentis TaxID=45151 RepID=A0A834RR83_9PLEO|nr:hypothetical protein PtrM4_129490 [Pyrenophora tritici-repentis]
MPPYRGNLDHKIELKPSDSGQPPTPSSQQLRPMSRDKARAVKLYVDNIIKKSYVERTFYSDVVLAHFDPDLKSILESDASDYVYAAVLSQVQSDGTVRLVAHLSKKMTPTKCNYEIYDKELLAIVRAFKEWRPELASVPNLVEAKFLEEFDFKIYYRSSKQGTKPNSLTRRTRDLLDKITNNRI